MKIKQEFMYYAIFLNLTWSLWGNVQILCDA